MLTLRNRHSGLVDQVDLSFKRSLMDNIIWDDRLIGIKGSRGVGKTTMLLQYIKMTYGTSEKALYLSLDDPYFFENSLIGYVDDFVARGGEHLFIDEVHKYPTWAIEIKKIYDYHPTLKIVFTGSSLLEILNARADLSRRTLIYTMQGLSFREFMEFRYGIRIKRYNLDDILHDHVAIATDIKQKFRPLAYFNEYLQTGYFPFYQRSDATYFSRLMEVINMVVEIELPALRGTDVSKVPKIKQLLYIISQSVPFKPNISSLADKIGISRNSLLEYIYALADANVLKSLHKNSYGVSLLQKPDKLYLENTNYAFALSDRINDKGNLRETFFFNQISATHKVTEPKKGDFEVDDNFVFEVGGKNKTDHQISGLSNAYLALDDIEYGYRNHIPLWLFGFLY